MLDDLREKNPGLLIRHIQDESFRKYGRIIDKYDFRLLKKWATENIAVPEKGNQYIASSPQLEGLKAYKELSEEFFGEMPIQIGYCSGNGCTLNALEYHKCSEINIAVTDYVILVGLRSDIDNWCYPSASVEAFFVPAFTSYEMFATTLHFAPCKTSEEGFKQVIVLPKGTNDPLANTQRSEGEDRLLFGKNKWLMIHPEHPVLKNSAAHKGITGENIQVHS